MENDCLFCKESASVFESKYFFVRYDDYPVRQGHLLIIPFRHVEELIILTRTEFNELHLVLAWATKHVEDTFGADGYNIGVNNGVSAGQTIPHLHIHLIPRYLGDIQDPRGGIRKFLPNPVTEYPLPP
jgi:diadenosine tetraphosphate (Ap4A) HIT family hydrolase